MKFAAVSVLATVSLFLSAGVQPMALAQSDDPTTVFEASAFGTEAFVDNSVTSGKTAFVILSPCSTNEGAKQTNSVGSVNGPPLFTTGAINSAATTSATASAASSDVHQVSALSGLITSDEIKAVSMTSEVNGGLQVSASGSAFVNLVVAGQKVNGTPDPNTRIDLAGFGHVILNEQISKTGNSSAKLIVNMIHVFITETNGLGIPTGTEIVVADARSGLKLLPNAALDGKAYGTRVNVGNVIQSGPSALEIMPCRGTDGKLEENTTAGVNVPDILTTGTVTDSVRGTVSASASMGESKSKVQAINLVSNLVSARVIRADVQASTGNGGFQFGHVGSTFVKLKVAGHPEIDDNVQPNTKVHIAGLGTLWLYRVTTTANNISVRMIELIVTHPNNLNIPVGTHVRVAVAEASLDTN